MIRPFCVVGIVFSITGATFAQGSKPAPEVGNLKAAAAKAIGLIEASQGVWYGTDQTCVSCHHQVLPLMLTAAAQDRGIPFDAKVAGNVAGKIAGPLKNFDEAVQGVDYIDAVGEAWYLIAAAAARVSPNPTTSAMALYLASAQRPDGGWFTMDARPPQSHGRITATAVSARAVDLFLPAVMKEKKQNVLTRARSWLSKAEPRTTEEKTFQLLGLLWTGAPEAERSMPAERLLKEQRPDGGWAQLPGMASDAYSTGEVLYALRHAGNVAVESPAYRTGLQFLLTSQADDGSWRVTSRLRESLHVSPEYFTTKFPYARHQYISVMGTTWAALALAEALPATERGHKRLPSLSAGPAGLEKWVDLVQTGSAADLKAALDRKELDPNAKTPHGTTALMLAANDLEKVKLLLERGADVSARAETGVDALSVAARRYGNAGVIKLLLSKGAKPNPPAGVAVKNQVSPLFFAVTVGDLEMAELLLDAAADRDAITLVLGHIPTSPLTWAAMHGDAAMVQLLLDRKADANAGDPPLHRAVIGNHVEVVKRLLAGGAKVNLPDRDKLTPLHYAATVEFGDTAILELLLAAGANRSDKDGQGNTALDLARAYKHTAAVAILGGKSAPR
jgi:ankyrin repeat protein